LDDFDYVIVMQPPLLLRPSDRRARVGLFAALLAAFLPLTSAVAQIPAFPGAEGFGAYATGGRGGDVYYVNNLNSSGPGSLRYGVETAPSQGRTIVFAVSGNIPINYNSDTGNQTVRIVQNKVTIAGQTAPGDGVALWDGRILVTGKNVVLRHLRIRHGDGGGAGDCLNMDNGVTNLMLDHISMAFSTDENISSFEQNPRPDLMTFQWSLNAWGLESHSCGGLWDLQRITTHHTLWAHHHTRNAKARPYGLLDWINNVTYDWDIGFIMGDSTTPAPWKANVRGSYFVCPPGNLRSVALEKASIDRNGAYNFTLHASTNLFDKNGNSALDGSDYGYGIASGSYQVSNAPIVVTGTQVPVTIDPPLTAYKKIVSRAGPLRLDALSGIPLRDEVDTILINNLVTLKRNHVSHENQTGASNNGMGFLNSTTAPTDADLDGMPDFWESTLGWNVAGQDHNTAMPNAGGLVTGLTFFPSNTPAGYTRLEEYLHFLAIPHATILRNTAGSPSSLSVDLRRYVSGFNKAPVTFTFSNVTNGTAVLQPDGYTAVFTPTLDYAGRARFDFAVIDGDGSTWTQTLGVLVSSAALPRNLTWQGDGSANAWNTGALNWLDDLAPVAFANGDHVVFDDTGSNSPNINLTTGLTPASIEVNASKNYTLIGSGSFGGSGPLTKSGSGILAIGTTNSSFAGLVELAGGTLTVSNGSAIGTGQLTLSGGAVFNVALAANAIFPANPIFIPEDESGTITSGATGNGVAGAVTGHSSSILNLGLGGTVSFNQTAQQFSGFPGTVNIPSGASLRFSNTSGGNGGASTIFQVNGALQPRNAGLTVTLGALTGAGQLAGQQTQPPSGGNGAVTYSVGAKNINSVFSGTLVDSNPTNRTSLTKVGSGTLTLTGLSPYAGTTTVSGGTVLVNGTNSASPAVVASGGTLGGTGRIGGLVTVNSGGKLAPGNGTGTLNLAGGLTLNSATLNCELANVTTVGGGVNDLISMAGGTLTLSGTSVVNPSFLNGSLVNGSYTLISGGSSTLGSAANLSWGGASGGRQTFGFDTATPGTVQLVVSGTPAASLVWRGFVNGNWNTTTSNWLNGAVSDPFYNLDTVLFDDTGLNVPTVNLTATVTPAAITVNSSGTYTFNGPAALTGPGTFTKTGSGTLNLNITNTSFSGNVLVSGGTLNMQGAGSKLNTGNLILSGGGTFYLPPSSPAYSYAGTITVLAGQSGTVASPGFANSFTGNVISGDTNSVLNIYDDVSFAGTGSAQFDGFTGTIHILPGGSLRFSEGTSGNTFGSLQPTFVINGTLRPRNAGNTIRLGALSGNGTITGQEKPADQGGTGNVTYNIGGNNTDALFTGVISDALSITNPTGLIKTGTGKLVLGGSSTFTAGTTVESGSLIVNNTTGSGTGTGSLSVAGGATLGGTGFIGSPTTLADFAILAPGNSAGTLTFNNDLDLGEFSVLNFELGTSNDAVVANAALTLQGTLNVIPAAGFGAGNYTLFTYSPAQTFNYSGLNLGTTPAGYTYAISTNTPGQVKLVVTPTTPPSFGPPLYSGGNLILSGTGGTPGANYYVLSSTNVTLSLASWQVLATNQFDGSGNFAYTNTVNAGTPQRFFRLQVP
jgi:autotransporter-associated beta strand protein